MDAHWSRTTRYMVLLLMLAAGVWFLWMVRPLIPPLLLACFLAYMLDPAVVYVNRWSRLPRTAVVSLVYVLLIGLLTITVVLSAPVIVSQAQLIASDLQNVQEDLIDMANTEAANLGLPIDFAEMIANFSQFVSDSFSSDQVFQAVDVLQATSQNLVLVLIVLVTTFYLLKDWHKLREWAFNLAPLAYRGDARRLYGEVKDIWQAYLWGQLVLMISIGVLSGLGAFLVGLQGAALALGILAGVLDLVPSAGPAVAMVIAGLVAWFQGPPAYLPVSNVAYAMILVGMFMVIQLMENLWLRPRVMSRSLNIHPAVVFVSVMGSLAISGILMALIIVPVISTLGVLGHYIRARIFGMDPWENPMRPVLVDAQESQALRTAIAAAMNRNKGKGLGKKTVEGVEGESDLEEEAPAKVTTSLSPAAVRLSASEEGS